MNPEDGKRLADAMERIATALETQMANNELSEIARENLELTEQQINAQMKRLRDNNWIEPDPDNTPEERAAARKLAREQFKRAQKQAQRAKMEEVIVELKTEQNLVKRMLDAIIDKATEQQVDPVTLLNQQFDEDEIKPAWLNYINRKQ
jgi:preprotein translocase subunit SecD